MNKKLAFLLSCCAAAGFMACNETVDWTYTEPSLGCTRGETKCDGNKLVKCENSMWTEGVECTGDTPVCGKNASNVDDCIAKPSLGCTTGETKCDGNKLVKCENAIWTEGVECTGDTPICGKNESNVDACIAKPSLGCTTGETKCEGNKLFTCENAIWNEGIECTGDTPICGTDESNVAACIADTTVKCVNGDDEYEVGDGYCDETGVAQVCGDDGEFEAATNCDGKICEVNENHVAACRDGKKCVINEETGDTVEHNALYCDTNGNVAKCDDGTGRVETACTAPEVCENASKTCKEPKTEDCMYEGSLIANGSTICKENGKVTCKDGNLSNVDKCTTDVENATAICTDVENVATCGYQCNEGYIEEGGKCTQVSSYTTIKAIRADYDKYSDFFIMGASKTCGDKGKNDTVGRAEVDVTGVVTGVRPNQYGFYIQDETGGIQVNCTDKACVKYADGTNVAIGDEVNVKSDGVGQYFCDLQIRASKTPLVVTKVADGKKMTPAELTEDDIAEIFVNKNPNAAKAGMLVTLSGVTPEGDYRTVQPKGWDVSTLDDKNAIVGEYLMGSASLKSGMSAGNSYRVDGVLVYTYSENVVAPRNTGDIEKECVEGTFLCDPTASTYSVCYWGTWSDQGSCKNFQYSSTTSAHGTAFACNDANDGCIITACEDGYEPTENGQGCQETTATNNCKNDLNGNKPALDSYYCLDENTSALCQADGSTVLETVCESTFKCNPSTVNTLGACGCTEATVNSCKDAKKFTCDPVTGKYESVDCPKATVNAMYSTPVCSEDNLTCDFTCKLNYVKNADNTGCVQCNTDEQCASRADGKTTCDTATNKCIAPVTPAECTQSVCNGIQYKECKDGKFQAETTCTTAVEHATAICSETTGCGFECDARYTLVDGKCELIDGGCLSDADCKGNADGKTTCDTKTGECIMPVTPVECTENEIVCDDNVLKMCSDGKWGKVETCTDDKPICSVKAEGCIQCNADADCKGNADGKNICNTETNTCVAPAECTEYEYACDGNVLMACLDGKWNEYETCEGDTPVCSAEVGDCVAATPATECTKDEDCASRTDDKTTCDTKTNTCVAPATPECVPVCSNGKIKVCDATGKLSDVAEDCPAVTIENAKAGCVSTSACGAVCNFGYRLDAGACVETTVYSNGFDFVDSNKTSYATVQSFESDGEYKYKITVKGASKPDTHAIDGKGVVLRGQTGDENKVEVTNLTSVGSV